MIGHGKVTSGHNFFSTPNEKNSLEISNYFHSKYPQATELSERFRQNRHNKAATIITHRNLFSIQ
jgi:hypothetical protein